MGQLLKKLGYFLLSHLATLSATKKDIFSLRSFWLSIFGLRVAIWQFDEVHPVMASFVRSFVGHVRWKEDGEKTSRKEANGENQLSILNCSISKKAKYAC